ncbi:uncharacterized protein LOC142317874 [Lycorma delicatula]|uniref:uncharacterized protein LOC142317874 n=1 Tax=Lycorma delicatula TaxID=130591 RepID=UPI003F51763F
MSPTLFSIYVDKILKIWKNLVDSGIRLCDGAYFNSLLYSYDIEIILESEDKLQLASYILNQTSKQLDILVQILPAKSKIVAFKGKWLVRSKIIFDGQILEQVRVFNYLGCDLSYDRNIDIDKKLSRFEEVCDLIRRTVGKQIREETQLRFYKTMAVPILTSDSEVWVLQSWNELRIQVAEMRFLRAVKGISRPISVMPLLGRLKEYRKRWSVHLMCMPLCRIPSQV